MKGIDGARRVSPEPWLAEEQGAKKSVIVLCFAADTSVRVSSGTTATCASCCFPGTAAGTVIS